jgi:hypothetical protein
MSVMCFSSSSRIIWGLSTATCSRPSLQLNNRDHKVGLVWVLRLRPTGDNEDEQALESDRNIWEEEASCPSPFPDNKIVPPLIFKSYSLCLFKMVLLSFLGLPHCLKSHFLCMGSSHLLGQVLALGTSSALSFLQSDPTAGPSAIWISSPSHPHFSSIYFHVS